MKKKRKTRLSKIIRKQQLQQFILVMATFAILFISLGMIVFHTFENNTYNGIDHGIDNQIKEIKDSPKVIGQTQVHGPGQNDPGNGPQPAQKSPQPKAPFQTSILIYNNKKELVNKSGLGNRYDVLKHVPMRKADLNKKINITINNMNFRT